jgi:hypothetical protein
MQFQSSSTPGLQGLFGSHQVQPLSLMNMAFNEPNRMQSLQTSKSVYLADLPMTITSNKLSDYLEESVGKCQIHIKR